MTALADPTTGLTADAAWPLQHAIPVSIGWCAAILAVCVPLAVRRYGLATVR
jgi:ABC-2 type transport system permease protein